MRDIIIVLILVGLVGLSFFGVVVYPLAEAQAEQMQTDNMINIQTQARQQAQAEAQAIRIAEAEARAKAIAETQAITEAITKAQRQNNNLVLFLLVVVGILCGFILAVAGLASWLLTRKPGALGYRLERLGHGVYMLSTKDNRLLSVNVRNPDDVLFLESAIRESATCQIIK